MENVRELAAESVKNLQAIEGSRENSNDSDAKVNLLDRLRSFKVRSSINALSQSLTLLWDPTLRLHF